MTEQPDEIAEEDKPEDTVRASLLGSMPRRYLVHERGWMDGVIAAVGAAKLAADPAAVKLREILDAAVEGGGWAEPLDPALVRQLLEEHDRRIGAQARHAAAGALRSLVTQGRREFRLLVERNTLWPGWGEQGWDRALGPILRLPVLVGDEHVQIRELGPGDCEQSAAEQARHQSAVTEAEAEADKGLLLFAKWMRQQGAQHGEDLRT